MKPVIHAPRQVPAALHRKIQEELDRMERLGVVVPTTTVGLVAGYGRQTK